MINGGAGAFLLGVPSVSGGGGSGLTDADQGLSVFNSDTVQLGQEFEQAGDPALISMVRQIPFLTGMGSLIYTETDYTIGEFFMEWLPTERTTYYDNQVLSPGFTYFGIGVEGQVCQLHWVEALKTYQFGGAGAQDDNMMIASYTSFDPTASLPPTALVHIAGGTGQEGDGQLKFEDGVPLATPEAGVMEFSGGVLFFSPADNDRRFVLLGLPAIGPTSQVGTPTEYIGQSGDVYLGTPATWFSLEFLGTTYKFPLYVDA